MLVDGTVVPVRVLVRQFNADSEDCPRCAPSHAQTTKHREAGCGLISKACVQSAVNPSFFATFFFGRPLVRFNLAMSYFGASSEGWTTSTELPPDSLELPESDSDSDAGSDGYVEKLQRQSLGPSGLGSFVISSSMDKMPSR